MSMTDPISDMLTRIRNAQMVQKRTVDIPASRAKVGIAEVLKEEGYIIDWRVRENGAHRTLEIELKYYQGEPVIERLQRVSRPGLRTYRGSQDLPQVMGGLGTTIVSTSRGIMTGQRARKEGHGGEVLCIVA